MDTTFRTILLADDDSDDLEMLDEALLKLDSTLNVLKATSGKQAIMLLQDLRKEMKPDLIVLDYNMPDLTGAEVLALISTDGRYSLIPKIIWSTSDSNLYQQICKDKGATHYFKKPHNISGIDLLAKNILAITL
jgi:CheY-like chemotaxis protein